MNNSSMALTNFNSDFETGWGSDFPCCFSPENPQISVEDQQFRESKLGRIFFKYAEKAVKKGYTRERSVTELLKTLTESNKNGMCYGFATSRLLSQPGHSDDRKSQAGLTAKAVQVIFFQAMHIFHLNLIKDTVKQLEPVGKAIEQRELDFPEQIAECEQAWDQFNAEVEKRTQFFDKIRKIELVQIRRLGNLEFLREKEIKLSSKLLEKVEKIFLGTRATAFRIGFSHQKDGHAICVNLLPAPMIYDINVGVISCADLVQTKTRLVQYLQYLLKDTANPLNSVTIEKFSEPDEEEIDICS